MRFINLVITLLIIHFHGISQKETEVLIPFNKKGTWGYVDVHSQQVIDPEFQEAYPFVDGVARVKKTGEVRFYFQTRKRDSTVCL